jgi:hypothetical protein
VPVTDPLPSGFDPGPGTSGDFGALARRSGRMLNPLGHAQISGAGNLLKKAIRALSTGDAQRAEQLILRAAQMPYDDREEGAPGVRAASMLVYLLITDQFEASEEDDMTWLDVVLAVHRGLDPTGRADVASVVHGFVLQPAFFAVSLAEKRRIRRAFGDAPLEPELGDSPSSTGEQRQDIIKSLVVAAVALGEAYAAAAPQPQV